MDPKAITTASHLRRELRAILEQGYSTSQGEIDSGAYAITVPVYDFGSRFPNRRLSCDLGGLEEAREGHVIFAGQATSSFLPEGSAHMSRPSSWGTPR